MLVGQLAGWSLSGISNFFGVRDNCQLNWAHNMDNIGPVDTTVP